MSFQIHPILFDRNPKISTEHPLTYFVLSFLYTIIPNANQPARDITGPHFEQLKSSKNGTSTLGGQPPQWVVSHPLYFLCFQFKIKNNNNNKGFLGKSISFHKEQLFPSFFRGIVIPACMRLVIPMGITIPRNRLLSNKRMTISQKQTFHFKGSLSLLLFCVFHKKFHSFHLILPVYHNIAMRWA